MNESDRAELVTSLGFFNFAATYAAAADKLRTCKVRGTHPHSPILFLYYHSIELYLKAFLRSHGCSVAELGRIGHKFGSLRDRSQKHGLALKEKTIQVLDIVAQPGVWIETRYLQVGSTSRPLLTALAQACRDLDRQVGVRLNEAGIRIRRVKRGVRVTD
jgi:hypothetical protein